MVRSPLFDAEPVIVVHLGTDGSGEGQYVAACCGEEFTPDDRFRYPNIPRVPCPGCLRTGIRRMIDE